MTLQNNGTPVAIARWPAGQEAITLANNLLVSAGATSIHTAGTTGGHTSVGDNSNHPQSYADAQYKLTTANRPTMLGIVGAEIASTLVV